MLSPIGMVDGGDVGFPKASRRASGARIAGPPSSSPLALSFGAALHQPTSAAPDAHRAAGSTPGTPGHKAGRNSASGQQDTAPEGLGLTVPLSAKPPSGKYLIALETPQPVSVQKNDAIAEAAALLGWKYERIQLGTDAEAGPRAFQDALERNPDMVHYSGTPAAAVQQQEAAGAQGVVAISDSNTEEVQPPLTSTSLDSTEQVEAWGEMSAATVVATSGEPTSVALVTIEAYPSLVAYTEKFIETMEKYCSACEVEVVNQQISDLGQTTPGAVVSTVQRNPDTEWVIFSFGDRALGVPAALRAANPQDQVKIGGETPSETNLEALRSGDEAFWTAFPTSILGWRVVDMPARHFVGDDLTPANEVLLPHPDPHARQHRRCALRGGHLRRCSGLPERVQEAVADRVAPSPAGFLSRQPDGLRRGWRRRPPADARCCGAPFAPAPPTGTAIVVGAAAQQGRDHARPTDRQGKESTCPNRDCARSKSSRRGARTSSGR